MTKLVAVLLLAVAATSCSRLEEAIEAQSVEKVYGCDRSIKADRDRTLGSISLTSKPVGLVEFNEWHQLIAERNGLIGDEKVAKGTKLKIPMKCRDNEPN